MTSLKYSKGCSCYKINTKDRYLNALYSLLIKNESQKSETTCIFAFMYVYLLYSVYMDVVNLFTSFPFLAVCCIVVDTYTCPQHVFSCLRHPSSSGHNFSLLIMVVAVVLRFSSWSPSLLSYGNPNRTWSLAEAFLVLISMKTSRVFHRVHYVVHPSVLVAFAPQQDTSSCLPPHCLALALSQGCWQCQSLARGQEMVDFGD